MALIRSDDRFETLTSALELTGLDEVLDEGGPLTIFAPTDDAFDALPDGVLDDLLDDEAALEQLLLHHAVDGEVEAEDVVDLAYTKSLAGQTLLIEAENGVMINDATVIEADLKAENGVLHVVDAVIELPAGTVVDIAAGDPDFSTLVTAVTAADLVDTLGGDGPYTVFAPPNSAFEDLPTGVLDALLDDTDALTEVLLYHVAGAELYAADLKDGEDIDTLLDDERLSVDLDDGVMIGGAEVTSANGLATNGVIHVIDSVLLPPGLLDNLFVVPEIVDNDARLSTLKTALEAADLVETLEGDGPFTLFAPTDRAFRRLPDGVLDSLLADEDALRQLLLHHVADGRVTAEDVVDVPYTKSLAGQTLLVDVEDDIVSINSAEVIDADKLGSNGVVHVIDDVLTLPAGTVVDIAIADPKLSTLVTAITTAGLEGTLSGDGPFSVFAPTNAAFDALPDGVLADLLDDTDELTRVLTYHVAGAELYAADLEDGAEIDTLLTGESLTVDLDGGAKVEMSNITVVDVLATNGVIHVIDAVLQP